MPNPVKCELKDGLYFIAMNRPEKKNAINLEMYNGLKDALLFADESRDVKVILLSGQGGAFSSGNDLADFLNFPEEIENNPAMQFISTIANVKKPIVAAVEGVAVGIGVTMILHCDLIVAGKSCFFQMPFVNLGLCPEAGSTFLLPLFVGYYNAARLTLLGEGFTADEAYRLGMVSFVVEDSEVTSFAEEVAKKVAEKPFEAIITTKRLLKAGFKEALSKLAEVESREFLSLLKKKEVTEKIMAFLNRKR